MLQKKTVLRENHVHREIKRSDLTIYSYRCYEHKSTSSCNTTVYLSYPNKKKCQHDKRSCVVVNVLYLPKLYIPHYYHVVINIKKLKVQIQNYQNRRSGEKENCIYETCKNIVMLHGRNIQAEQSYMQKETMCAYLYPYHALPHWKCVFKCCSKCPCFNLPDQKTDDQYSNISTSIRCHIYHIHLCCTSHRRLLLNDKKCFCMCKQDSDYKNPQIYTLETRQ